MHPLPKVPETEIKTRVRRFQNTLSALAIDGALITQNIDIFYLTGTMQNGLLYVPQSGEPLFYAKKSIDRASFESVIPVVEMGRQRELGQKIASRFGQPKKIGLEMDVLPYGLAKRYLSLFPGAEAADIAFALRQIRAVKSEYELKHIREAGKHLNEIIASLPGIIAPGMTELELSAKIEYALRLKGNIGIFRMRGYNQELCLGMVSSGSAAATPTYFDGPAGGLGLSIASPQSASRKKLQAGEPILVDISNVVEGYLIDQTRMAVIGDLDPELERAYQIAVGIIREAERMGVPGTPWQALYQRALEMAAEAGLSENFMGYGRDQVKFLGHGVGLEMDELPILARGFDQPLEEGMVIAIEPKFTFPGRGVIGIENTYVVTAEGLKALTIAPEEIIRIPEK
ncbi:MULTISPECIES: Xaa-Pro peptidase family protein [Thermoactinomyces]|jgi:Xaa-Pro dipeptidase|uniref:Aminopeptidase P family protein n=1 Tax=Thermoactinomyces daqus TaxID=1329516 RepID=A0A7W2AHZ2_9BACL|nr:MULTISPECIES: Xaa-Pro peptidase family protein [Thermoactinomyces]MBA4543702.1 aminopeptidase P family protein [Thermoactinomyces daqus]MBH8597483.1 aminopeptidase P family protein [Thermoactinomyces sp. CICC 10523]MBH8603824.1 aminopeptidase P family protein [Thermoactinomyces sp. CICC 10522]MBH8608567.1 aminopeptidase P family protein [Thermoactinomyces sp. CICC 10521]